MMSIVLSPAFLIALFVLLLNDFVFKASFHNLLTGKLSDFAGLFAFTLFLAALAPKRRSAIFATTTVAFVAWKTPWSQRLIDTLNAFLPWRTGRTVDLTDLIALFILPLSWIYIDHQQHSPLSETTSRRTKAYCLGAVSLFAFTATTTIPPEQLVRFDKEYPIGYSPESVERNLNGLNLRALSGGMSTYFSSGIAYDLYLDKEICDGFTGVARIVVYPTSDGKSRLTLESIRYHCEARVPGDSQKLLDEFRSRILDPLQNVK